MYKSIRRPAIIISILFFILSFCMKPYAQGKAKQDVKKKIRILTVGASFWHHNSKEILGMLFSRQDLEVECDGRRGNGRAYFQLECFENGRLDLLDFRNEGRYKQARADIQELEKCLKTFKPDYILYQEHSVQPIIDPFKAALKMRKFIAALQRMSPESEVILCMTWVKKNEDRAPDRAPQCWSRVFHAYREAADRAGVRLAPSGAAFMIAKEERPTIPILQVDSDPEKDGHQSMLGQYLNCCVIYAAVTGKSPVGLPAKLEVRVKKNVKGKNTWAVETFNPEPETVRYLQELAWFAVSAEKKDKMAELSAGLPAPVIERSYVREYDGKGRLVMQHGSPEFIRKMWRYKESANPCSMTMVPCRSHEEAEDKNKISETAYEYDTEGRLVKMLTETCAGTARCEYIFGDNGRPISGKCIDTNGKVTELNEYRYDTEGCLAEKRIYRTYSEYGTQNTKVSFSFGTDGRLEGEDLYAADDGILLKKTGYVYNDIGLLEKKTVTGPDNELLFIRTYEYDEKNNPVLEKETDAGGRVLRRTEYRNHYRIKLR